MATYTATPSRKVSLYGYVMPRPLARAVDLPEPVLCEPNVALELELPHEADELVGLCLICDGAPVPNGPRTWLALRRQ